MFESLLHICLNIIIIGGAIVVILAIIALIRFIMLINKISYIFSDLIENYNFVKNIIYMPMELLKKFLNKKK